MYMSCFVALWHDRKNIYLKPFKISVRIGCLSWGYAMNDIVNDIMNELRTSLSIHERKGFITLECK